MDFGIESVQRECVAEEVEIPLPESLPQVLTLLSAAFLPEPTLQTEIVKQGGGKCAPAKPSLALALSGASAALWLSSEGPSTHISEPRAKLLSRNSPSSSRARHCRSRYSSGITSFLFLFNACQRSVASRISKCEGSGGRRRAALSHLSSMILAHSL